MTPIIVAVLVLAAAVAFGRWRRFSSIQWIWMLFSTALGILLIWAILLIFVVGPEMKRTLGPASQGGAAAPP